MVEFSILSFRKVLQRHS